MTYKKIYMTFNIERHMHARVIFRWQASLLVAVCALVVGGDVVGVYSS